mgnify:CR=1 FL=1
MNCSAFKWLLCLLLSLALAQPLMVMAMDHHEDEPCLFTDIDLASGAIDVVGSVSIGDHDASHMAECCMPCAQCAVNLALLIEDATSPRRPCLVIWSTGRQLRARSLIALLAFKPSSLNVQLAYGGPR